ASTGLCTLSRRAALPICFTAGREQHLFRVRVQSASSEVSRRGRADAFGPGHRAVAVALYRVREHLTHLRKHGKTGLTEAEVEHFLPGCSPGLQTFVDGEGRRVASHWSDTSRADSASPSALQTISCASRR